MFRKVFVQEKIKMFLFISANFIVNVFLVKTKSPKKKEEVVAVAEKKVVKKNVTIIPRTEFMGTANSRNSTFFYKY